MRILLSPLRYPGSKIRLVRYLGKTIVYNQCLPEIFVEPFVGGGSVFLNVLANDWAEEAIIGDLDPLVYSFWRVLFENPQYLIEFVDSVRIDIGTFKHYKSVATGNRRHSNEKLAEACLFLNRTSFSGMLGDNVGPIGGTSQRSQYKLDCRFNRLRLKVRLERAAKLRDRVTILPLSWAGTVDYALELTSSDTLLFYFDPPFYAKADRIYRYSFGEVDHRKLCRRLKSLKCDWLLSYDRADAIGELYRPFVQRNVTFPYSINSPARRIEKEFFIMSPEMQRIPKKLLG